jgi:MgtC family
VTSTIRAACAATLIAFAVCPTIVGYAQVPYEPAAPPGAALTVTADGPFDTTWDAQFEPLFHALVRLPAAALLSTILAFRPRRRGTPKRQAPVIQTQIVLALVGAMVMMVVGSSLARAFGIVGAAGLIRYRAKIEDPKDAVVMLSTLTIGLASGVGLYLFAIFATFFVLAVLVVVESIETEPYLLFDLTITAKESANLKDAIEMVLRRRRIPFELRGTSEEEICYEVKLALGTHTDTASEALMALKSAQPINVKWEQKKDTK